MPRNTRTFTDLDLNFRPVPSAYDRINGIGTITASSDSHRVSGTNTKFHTLLNVNDNLYVRGNFIGKVSSIESETSLTLYYPAKITRTVDIHDVNDYTYTILTPVQYEITRSGYTLGFTTNKDVLTEGSSVTFILTGDAPNGHSVDYVIRGIQKEDIDSELSGSFVFSNGNASITINVLEDQLKEILETIVVELVGHGYVIPNSSFTYSTPGDITIKTDENAIKASIRNLVMTMNYERPFNSKLGSQSRAIFFELATPMTEILLKRSVADVIRNFEPRVNVDDVKVSVDSETHSARITIYFTILNTTEPLQVTVILERTR